MWTLSFPKLTTNNDLFGFTVMGESSKEEKSFKSQGQKRRRIGGRDVGLPVDLFRRTSLFKVWIYVQYRWYTECPLKKYILKMETYY